MTIPTSGMTPATGAPPPQDDGAADKAQQKAGEVAGQAKEQAGQAAEQAKGKLREQLDQRSTRAGEQVGGTAGDVRSVAVQLREQGKQQPAKIAEQAADRIERAGSYLRENDSDRFLSDLEDFGRRQPWAIAAGGLVLGFAASRFLKASSEKRYESSSGHRAAGTSAGPYAGTGNGMPRTGGAITPPTAHPADELRREGRFTAPETGATTSPTPGGGL